MFVVVESQAISQYFWGRWPVCPCNDTSCVVMKRYPDGRYMWYPQDCNTKHSYLCKIPKASPLGIKGKPTESGKISFYYLKCEIMY